MDKYYIKGLRKHLKLSQRQLAEKIGVKTNTIAQWEGGHRSPSGSAKILLEMLGSENRV